MRQLSRVNFLKGRNIFIQFITTVAEPHLQGWSAYQPDSFNRKRVTPNKSRLPCQNPLAYYFSNLIDNISMIFLLSTDNISKLTNHILKTAINTCKLVYILFASQITYSFSIFAFCVLQLICDLNNKYNKRFFLFNILKLTNTGWKLTNIRFFP